MLNLQTKRANFDKQQDWYRGEGNGNDLASSSLQAAFQLRWLTALGWQKDSYRITRESDAIVGQA